MQKNCLLLTYANIIFYVLLIPGVNLSCSQESKKSIPGEYYQELSHDGAWCWFADPRAVCYNTKIFSGWVDSFGSIWVGSLDLQTGQQVQINLHPKFEKDDHTNPALIILPDRHIMIFYSGHGGTESLSMRYRVSKNSLDISEWSDEIFPFTNTGGPRGFCYPNPIQLSGEKN